MADPRLLGASDGRARFIGGAVCGVLAIALVVYAPTARSWYAGFLALLALIALVAGVRSRAMQLEFEVGDREKHQVVFRFNKFWGNLSITVDGSPAVRDLRILSLRLTKTYNFMVGGREVHTVRVEKDRALFLAGARRQPVRAYVDDVLAAEGAA